MRRAPPAARGPSSTARRSSRPPLRPSSSPHRAREGSAAGSVRRDVDRTDLARLDSITALLLTLNDPRASAPNVARHVMELEVLAARVAERFMLRKGAPLPRLVEQIALLGNREIEELLLAFLEDIVALHSETSGGAPPAELP